MSRTCEVLFQVGDAVDWLSLAGRRSGRIVARTPYRLPDGNGRPSTVESLRLTIREDGTGRIITRDIRGCAARHKGPHVLPATEAA